MAANKTTRTDASVEAYFAAIADASRRDDCRALAALMAKVSGQAPAMWGSSIVGFGSYHYRYDSGREGDSCLVGFASRKSDIAVYLTAEVLAQTALLAKLGRHKTAKGCLYLRAFGDVDAKILATLVQGAIKERKLRYG